MGALGGMISNAVTAYNSEEGAKSSTNLESFLEKFTNQSGRYVDTLDPLGTFDVRISFFPTITMDEMTEGPDKWDRVGQSLVNSLKSMGKNALDNLTGGLFSAATEGGAGSIITAHDQFAENGKHSFIEYLAPANLLEGGEQWQNADQQKCPLVLNLGPYVQSISGLQLKVAGDNKSQTMFGEFPITGTYIQTDGTLQMSIVNTKAALHERLFYPWMRECTLPFWSYETQPYTTATIDIDFTKHNDVHYVFFGCRPTMIKLLDATQEADSGNITREVSFAYDFMFITSDLKVNDSVASKLLGSAGSLVSGAASMINL